MAGMIDLSGAAAAIALISAMLAVAPPVVAQVRTVDPAAAAPASAAPAIAQGDEDDEPGRVVETDIRDFAPAAPDDSPRTLADFGLAPEFRFTGRAVRLDPAALAETEKLALAMQRLPHARITLEGHVAHRPGETRTQALKIGERRAVAVRDRLISLGIATDRIETISYGRERPRSIEDPAANDRVAIIPMP